MNIEYKEDRVWLDSAYKNIISYFKDNNRNLIRKVVCHKDFIIVFSNKKPSLEKFNSYMTESILNSTSKIIGFSTYKTDDHSMKYATEISIENENPKSYVQIYTSLYDFDEFDIKRIISIIEEHIPEKIIKEYEPHIIAASTIIIISEHENMGIDTNKIIELANTDSTKMNLCKNDIIKNLDK